MSSEALDKDINGIIEYAKWVRTHFQSDNDFGLSAVFQMAAKTAYVEYLIYKHAEDLGVSAKPGRGHILEVVNALKAQNHPLADSLEQENDWSMAFWTKADAEAKAQNAGLKGSIKIAQNVARDMPFPLERNN